MPTARPGVSPLILGEVLHDCFTDGRRVLGGAPFNVAWHLRGFGLAPRLVTRVGDDRRGRAIRGVLDDWGLDARLVQTDPERPTGRVDVALAAGEASFTIPAGQAFDRIAPPDPADLPGAGGILYHGTLALREGSREALAALREGRDGVFLDVNLRDPWWEAGGVQALAAAADWVKANHHEIARLAPGGDPAAACAAWGLRGLILTEGARRVAWYGPEGLVAEATPPEVSDVADTVGAGDAFSAVTIIGLIAGWKPEIVLDRAAAFAADICRQAGATAADPPLYDRSWRAEIPAAATAPTPPPSPEEPA